MNSEQLFDRYKTVLSRKSGTNAENSKVGRKIEKQAFKAQLKKVVEFPHPEKPGRTQVISSEVYEEEDNSKSSEGEFGEFAVLLRDQVDLDGNPLRYQLEVQSRDLRDYLKEVGREYRDMNVYANPIVITYPFHPLFMLRTQFAQRAAEETTSALGKEITLLLDFIRSTDGLAEIVKKYDDLVPNNKISFDMLWSMYAPNEVVYYHEDCIEQCFLVEHVEFDIRARRYVAVFYVVGGGHDGTKFGLLKRTIIVPMFTGVLEINTLNLPIIPIRLMPREEREQIESRLIKRGRDYLELQTQKFKYMECFGNFWSPQMTEKKMFLRSDRMRIETNHRIVIDANAAAELQDDCGECLSYGSPSDFISPNVDQYLKSFAVEKKASDSERFKNPRRSSTKSGESRTSLLRRVVSSDSLKKLLVESFERHDTGQDEQLQESWRNGKQKFPITAADELLCPPRIDAFLLDRKVWIWVLVSNVKEINWYPDPYEALQLNPQKKKLIQALVKSFNSSEDTVGGFDDVVQGKGKGLILLLHGLPGLGKTFTAETLAEQIHRPLYHVTGGELGTELTKIETQLENVFKLGWRWGAIVLIDEADVLLSRRDERDLQRSGIVAIFLRMIEYYKGLLFLTTNQVDLIDAAFLSRVHVSIEYQRPDAEARTKIWRNLLTKERDSIKLDASWDDNVYDILGQLDVHGRDIRNLIRTAYQYATSQKTTKETAIGVRHVKMIMEETCKAVNVNDITRDLHKFAIRSQTFSLEEKQ